MSHPITLSRDEARRRLLSHLGLMRAELPPGDEGARALLGRLRCIQLDPLDALGTNADLVAMARVDGLRRGQIYDALLPGHAFEHWAKERCILPADAFPWYRNRSVETSWWRHSVRLDRLPEGILERVLAEIDARGASTPSELTHHGTVEPLDWSGWKGTSSATTMALEVLWTRCDVVVCGRASNGKRYDLPRRALGPLVDAPADGTDEGFGRWALHERARAAGILARAKGPWWGMLDFAHGSDLPERMVADGTLVAVTVEGARRPALATPGFLEAPIAEPDGRMRLLGPLDPALWDRKLVQHLFGFEYVWEVYKPKETRRWGWYVCPLLHGDALCGRLEGRVRDGRLVIDRVWEERPGSVDPAALDALLERHAVALGAEGVERPRRFEASAA